MRISTMILLFAPIALGVGVGGALAAAPEHELMRRIGANSAFPAEAIGTDGLSILRMNNAQTSPQSRTQQLNSDPAARNAFAAMGTVMANPAAAEHANAFVNVQRQQPQKDVSGFAALKAANDAGPPLDPALARFVSGAAKTAPAGSIKHFRQ